MPPSVFCRASEGSGEGARREHFGWLTTNPVTAFWINWRGLSAHAGRPVRRELQQSSFDKTDLADVIDIECEPTGPGDAMCALNES